MLRDLYASACRKTALLVCLAGFAGGAMAPLSYADEPLFEPVFTVTSLDGANGGDGSDGFVMNGTVQRDNAGSGVAILGDVNGDGIDDMAIGAPYFGTAESGVSGVYVVFGRRGTAESGFPANVDLAGLDGNNGFVIVGIPGKETIGGTVAGIGDLNGDGIADLAVGGRPNYYDDTHRVRGYVIFGQNTATGGPFPAELSVTDLYGPNGFAIRNTGVIWGEDLRVSAVGDVNEDGVDDLLLSLPSASTSGIPSSGEAAVLFGRNVAVTGTFPVYVDLAELNGINGFKLLGLTLYDRLGEGIGRIGDINNDGIDDLAVSARGYQSSSSTNPNGHVVVMYGRDVNQRGYFAPVYYPDLFDPATGFKIQSVDEFLAGGGWDVSGGDFNGDGIADIVTGTAQLPSRGSTRIHVVFGRDAALSGQFPATVALDDLDGGNGWTFSGLPAATYLSLDSAGDVNGDGLADIVVGGRLRLEVCFSSSITCEEEPGWSRVIFGRTGSDALSGGAFIDLSEPDGVTAFAIEGVGLDDLFGISVSNAGDVNGDGLTDLLIGAPGVDIGESDSVGQAFAIYGRQKMLEPEPQPEPQPQPEPEPEPEPQPEPEPVPDCTASFDPASRVLTIPAVETGSGPMDMTLVQVKGPLFEQSGGTSSDPDPGCRGGALNEAEGILSVPVIGFNGQTLSAEFTVLDGDRFRLDSAMQE